MQISRGKFDRLHRTPAGFTAQTFDGHGLHCLLPTRPICTASNPISVRQVAVLLHASFRPRLTATPLRFANPSPPSGWIEDLHLQTVKHARHTTKGLTVVFRESFLAFKNSEFYKSSTFFLFVSIYH